MMTEAGKSQAPGNLAVGAIPIDRAALLRLASDGSAASKHRLLRVMQDLQGAGGVLTDRERALVADILKKLVKDFEREVRSRLAAILTHETTERLPQRLLHQIREGEIDVARRLLMSSPLLDDADLIEIVHHRAQQHRLATALRRPAVGATDAQPDVVETLLNHPDHMVASAAVDYLVEEAKRLDSFQEPVLRREELTRPLAERVAALVSAALRRHLLERFDGDPGPLDDALEAVIRDGGSGHASTDPPTAAFRLAGRLRDAGLLEADLMLCVLRHGEVALFEAMLAVRAALPPPRIRRVLSEPSGRSLAMLCRALELSRGAFGSIHLLRTQHGDARIRDPAAFTEALAFFDGVSPTDALDLIRLWRRDAAYVEAVEQLRSL